MRYLIALVVAVLTANVAFAADATCEEKAAEKKLAGAAKNSFIKKCTTDSMTPAEQACDAQAKEKKLAGAAKNSFVKKCVSDAK
ncbi:hypothetical protein VVD49_15240 [Uliginosibacterium sp. H3]|uniref:PsiF repeat-containing protein n=1 Tax=Uliginosibacterium silvisoli TaxID=3114758 RepID=A0ABU6K6G6_9RHOO|nr:hypothetical protein [Uliginosibacterium sp. H3]